MVPEILSIRRISSIFAAKPDQEGGLEKGGTSRYHVKEWNI